MATITQQYTDFSGKIARHLANGDCVNLTIPPQFGENKIITHVEETLKNSDDKILICTISVDTVSNLGEFVEKIYRTLEGKVQLPQRQPQTYPELLFEQILQALSEKQFVLILRRVEKLLDIIDAQFLGTLRDVEAQDLVTTFTCTPYSLPKLKKIWAIDGKAFSQSDYGDSHELMTVPPPEDTYNFESIFPNERLRDTVCKAAMHLTGGYPDLQESLFKQLRVWRSENEEIDFPDRSAWLKFEMTLESRLDRFLEKFCMNGTEVKSLNALLDLHWDTDPHDEAYLLIKHHPWGSLLLLDDRTDGRSLKARVIHHAAFRRLIALDISGDANTRPRLVQRFHSMYEQRDYEKAIMVLQSFTDRPWWLNVNYYISKVMKCLYHQDIGPSEDTNWNNVIQSTQDLEKALRSHTQKIEKGSLHVLQSKINNLKSLAIAITSISSKSPRVVDELSTGSADQQRSCICLLEYKFQQCNSLKIDGVACQLALSLPEQVIRVWGQWATGTSYSNCPGDEHPAWEPVKNNWASEDPLKIPAAGKSFNSIQTYAFFCLSKALVDGVDRDHLPTTTFNELKSDLGKITPLRNAKAHSFSLTTPKSRENFFEVTRRWLDNITKSCLSEETIEEIREIIEPMPCIDDGGQINYALSTPP